MIQEWLAKGIFLYLMAGVCGAGILLKLLLTSYYNRQLRQASNMNRAKKRWLLKMQQEYADCMDMHGKVNNVDIFVDKYVEGKKFMGIMLSTWDKIGGQAWVLCAGLLVMAAVSGIFYQVDREAILFTFFIGIWTVIVDIVVDNVANLVEKRKQLKRNLMDYFDNHAWDGVESVLPEEGEEEDFSAEEAYWEEGNFSQEDDFDENAAFSREAGMEQEERTSGEDTSGMDTYSGAIRIRHLVKQESAAEQEDTVSSELEASVQGERGAGTNVDFEEWKRKTGADGDLEAEGNAPKFYVVRKAECDRVAYGTEYAKSETAKKELPEEAAPGAGKKVRKESKKEMAARKKREHMKYELKREITHKAEGKEPLAVQAKEQEEKKNTSQEAVEQLAAAIDILKKENALEQAAPLLAAQISRDQENGALIEEVLREFLV